MSYELIENITSADIAVRIKAVSYSLLFKNAAEALMSEMVEDISAIKRVSSKNGNLMNDDISLLFFEFLNELLFFKDAENLLLLPSEVEVLNDGNLYSCKYTLEGQKINRNIHKFKVDIKAVTLHGLRIYSNDGFFIAESVFDV